jgi:hypothetical protein
MSNIDSMRLAGMHDRFKVAASLIHLLLNTTLSPSFSANC